MLISSAHLLGHMTDPQLLHRVDAGLALLGAWLALVVLLACFALMVVDLVVGLLALATVLGVTLVGVRSYVRAGRAPPTSTDSDPGRPTGR